MHWKNLNILHGSVITTNWNISLKKGMCNKDKGSSALGSNDHPFNTIQYNKDIKFLASILFEKGTIYYLEFNISVMFRKSETWFFIHSCFEDRLVQVWSLVQVHPTRSWIRFCAPHTGSGVRVLNSHKISRRSHSMASNACKKWNHLLFRQYWNSVVPTRFFESAFFFKS